MSIKATAKRLLPELVIREVQKYRSYQGLERPLYLRIRMLDGIGRANPKLPAAARTSRSFIFVCFGNIMRSPLCEALMKRTLIDLSHPEISVTSAGLNAVPGTMAHPWAIEAAREFGISLDNHRAKIITTEMVEQAGVIFVMDFQNQVQLHARFPAARNKLFMLSAYAGEGYRSAEIRDPYHFGPEETRRCYRTLNTCIQNLARFVADSQTPKSTPPQNISSLKSPWPEPKS